MTEPNKEEGSMKIGVFTVSLPDLTPEEAVREIKDAGYDGVEWRVARVPEEVRGEQPSFWGNNLCTLAPTEEEARRARRVSEEAGLEVPGLGTYVGVGDLEAAEEAMRFAVTAGASQVRVGAGAPDGRSYEELFAAASAFLADVEELAKTHGVKALVEIHHRTICPSSSTLGIWSRRASRTTASGPNFSVPTWRTSTSRTPPSIDLQVVACGSHAGRRSRTG
jgi:sugar phosphate isomerase/epimerase